MITPETEEDLTLSSAEESHTDGMPDLDANPTQVEFTEGFDRWSALASLIESKSFYTVEALLRGRNGKKGIVCSGGPGKRCETCTEAPKGTYCPVGRKGGNLRPGKQVVCASMRARSLVVIDAMTVKEDGRYQSGELWSHKFSTATPDEVERIQQVLEGRVKQQNGSSGPLGPRGPRKPAVELFPDKECRVFPGMVGTEKVLCDYGNGVVVQAYMVNGFDPVKAAKKLKRKLVEQSVVKKENPAAWSALVATWRASRDTIKNIPTKEVAKNEVGNQAGQSVEGKTSVPRNSGRKAGGNHRRRLQEGDRAGGDVAKGVPRQARVQAGGAEPQDGSVSVVPQALDRRTSRQGREKKVKK